MSQFSRRKKSTPSCRLHDAWTTEGGAEIGKLIHKSVITAPLIKLIATLSRSDSRLLLFYSISYPKSIYLPHSLNHEMASVTDGVTSER